ncbi:sensor histidine kinase [Shivajiella indica]|uniref:Sensor histidine kinase n=1 Tax=Shivajiella indica TaxID=872115 RepID=A0ABW5B4N6_9BACT
MTGFQYKISHILNITTSFIYRYKIHHVLFWLGYYMFWVWVYNGAYQNIHQLLIVTTFYTLSNAGIYYTSQYLLVPKLLSTNKAILFILAFLILAAMLSVFMYFGIALALDVDLRKMFSATFFQIFLVYFSSNVFIGAILLSIKGFLTYRKNLRTEELKEKERIESELNFLKSQVNPHFLFNAINSVFVLIKIDPEKASETLLKLSDLLRSQLYEFSAQTIDIQQEIAYLKNYIELEQIRKGEKLKVDFQVGEGLHDFTIYPLLFIPFLENCFKHLSSYSDKKNEIRVRIEKSNGNLMANFFNTKESSITKNDQEMGGIGLKNIKRRLDLLYPGNYELNTRENPDTYEVDLKIKL